VGGVWPRHGHRGRPLNAIVRPQPNRQAMKRIVVPTESGADWKRLLAKPDLHWKPGKSAMSAAARWEAANSRLPVELSASLEASMDPDLVNLELLLAVPEWEVELPGGVTSSHTDVLALARNERGLVAVAVEAKVDEAFGPTLGETRAGSSDGQRARLKYLHEALRLKDALPDSMRYQLLHRTVSAIETAQQFHAHVAVMLVQSFSPVGRWREDFDAFCRALGGVPKPDAVVEVPGHQVPRLFVGWCGGGQQFSATDLRVAV
jgi:hypothetical protein